MQTMDRIPAIPLIANDPYFSVWMPCDTLNGVETIHWTGVPKPMNGHIKIDGKKYCWLGKSSCFMMKTESLKVYPTRTVSVLSADGVELTVTFWSPALPDDLDALSIPVTFVDFDLHSTDGKTHEIELNYNISNAICYDGQAPKPMVGDAFCSSGLNMAFIGQEQQHVLGHSGDHITIDWGYLYLASTGDVNLPDNRSGLGFSTKANVADQPVRTGFLLGYDDIASIQYFGSCCKAWGLRTGKTMPQVLTEFSESHDALLASCVALDEKVLKEAEEIGGEDYALIAAASWRHTFAAHKLIATPAGEMAFLSKENDSNGCIGTVDVSYPSIPLFLKFCPELVNALCRPVLEFASMPVWQEDFAPHDVGRYPYATGQVYAARHSRENGVTPLPYYLYPAENNVYDFRHQMPVEECGNMLIMMETAISFGAEDKLVSRYMPLLEKWVRYLDKYGEDPGEQLCTDDFAGHLARNINLSAKAIVGIACFARIQERLGRAEESRKWASRAREMAASWLKRAASGDSTALTFDGTGWSMKYNLVWDLILGLDLLPKDFYDKETRSYLDRMNQFGLPLDSRADYTKSDWMVWSASLSQDRDVFCRLIAPLAYYLRNTPTRLPFSDWYDTKSGRYVSFIGRSVQGGVYMPFLLKC